jgi:BASS family bile acid:Na+ symporter
MDSTATIILAGALIIIMLGMGLSLVTADFKRIFLYPKAIFTGLVNQIVLLPLIGFAVVSVFTLQPEIAVGVMILTACPGGPTSNLIAHLAKGNLALSVSLTALSSLVTVLSIPFIVNFATSKFMDEGMTVQLNILETIVQICVIVVIPVVLGMLLRHYKPGFAARMARPVRIASGVVLGLIILGLVIKERENFFNYFQQAGMATLVLNVATMAVGYFSARWLRLRSANAVSIAIESGIQNGTLAITIAVVLLNNTAFAIAPAVYSLLMFFTGAAVIWLGNRKPATELED